VGEGQSTLAALSEAPLALWSPIVGAIGALLSVLLFYLNHLWSRAAKRRDLTIELWKLWLSPEMLRFRSKVDRRIKELHQGRLRVSKKQIVADADMDTAMGAIERFMIAAAELHKRNLVHKALFDALLNDRFATWRETLAWVDFDTGTAPSGQRVLGALDHVLKGSKAAERRREHSDHPAPVSNEAPTLS